jgi:hypothetical protein
MVSTTTLDETVRELQATMDLRNNMLLNTLNQRDLAQAEQLRFRDERLMQQVAQLISNRQESLNQVPAQRSNESRSLRPQENNQSQNNFDYQDLDPDNIVGGDALRNAMSRLNLNEVVPVNAATKGYQDSPIKSLEFLFKSGSIQKQVLRSSPDTFRPWLKYVNQILDGLWLSSLTKINPYRVPKKETWSEWDRTCLDSENHYIPDLMEDCKNNRIFHVYLDPEKGNLPISKKTPTNILNAMYLLVVQHWPSLVHVLHQILTASIDNISLSFLIPESVGSPDTIRSMYFGGINYHSHNSEIIVLMKVQSFQKRGSFHANINEPPETVLQKLRLAAQEINAMAVNQDLEPISQTMLRMKFLEVMQDIPQYKQAISVLNLQVKEDTNGNPIPLTLDEYTKKLQIIFLEAKESSFRQRVNLVQEEQTNLAQMGRRSSRSKYPEPSSVQSSYIVSKDFSKSKQGSGGPTRSKQSKGPRLVCYSFRDKGTCHFGSNCKFSHEKPTTAFTVATQEELDEQYGANAVYQYKRKKSGQKFYGKAGNAKKMSNHRDKIRSYNSKRQGAHSSEVIEDFEEEPEVKEEVQVNSAEVDQPSEDPFYLSTSDSDSGEDL